jgi:hypothetical protein
MSFVRPRGSSLAHGLLFGAVVAAAALAVPRAALAGPNPLAKIILHAVPWNNRLTCAAGQPAGPEQVVTKADLFPARYAVYALVVDGTPGVGISGVQFGIAYNDTLKRGVDVLDWQECSLFNWPTPGWPTESFTGNLLTWNSLVDCDTTGIRVAGFFYVTAYSPDRLRVIPRPVDSRAAVVDCMKQSNKAKDTEDLVPDEHLGYVDFGGGDGYNPWDPRQSLLNLRKPGRISTREKSSDAPPGKSGNR